MMIRSALIAAIGLALTAALAPAQDFSPPPNRVWAFFSASPTLASDVRPDPGAAGIAVRLPLRPNVEQSAYVYAFNPKDDDATVTVILAAGTNAGGEIARTAQPILVPSKQVVKVALTGRAAPAPAAPAKDAKEAPIPQGVKIADLSKLYLFVEEKGDKPGRFDAKNQLSFEVEVPIPGRDPTFSVEFSCPKDGALAVRVKFAQRKDNPLFTDKPAKVRLDLRPDFNEKLDPATVNQGTFEAEVPVDGEATLFAEGVKFKDNADGEAIACVSVDGYDRSFRIKTNFRGQPDLQTTPFVNVRLSSLAQVPGKPVTVTVEADDDKTDTVLSVDRIGGPERKFETMKNFGKKPRQKAIYVSVGGEGDAVKFVPVVKDWTVEFATENVAGTRYFKVRNGDLESLARRLLIDRTPPAKIKLELPPKDKLLIGSEQAFSATGEDAESDIAKVYFYAGDAPAADGKPAPGSRVIPGVKADGAWTTQEPFRLPELRGEVKYGVLFVNGVGLASAAEANVYVREPEKPKEEKDKEKPKKTTGSIEGTVMQSIRPQPDLPVVLKDAAGKEVKKTTTDSGGKFEFKDLPPGDYVVTSVKRADQNANGSKDVTVEAGDKPAKVEILIKR